jgi:hypothetical protein
VKHGVSRIYAILSIACPIATVAIVHISQTRAHSDFWEEVQQSEDGVQHVAGALMALWEIGELVLYTTLACIVGLMLAFISIQLRRNWTILGLVCLCINATPLLFGAFLLMWWRI